VIPQRKRDATTEGAFAWASVGDSELEYVFAIRDKNGNTMGMLLVFNHEFEELMWTQTSLNGRQKSFTFGKISSSRATAEENS
jgi:hypothetical protein